MKRILAVMAVAMAIGQGANAQFNMNLIGQLTYPVSLSDIWGYVDTLNNEYALVGRNDGFSVVDLSVPATPTEVFFEAGPSSIWRDIKTWDKHAYVTTEGGGGLLIVDLSPLPGAVSATTLYTGSSFPFSSVHNLYIDENGVCYLFGADYGNGGVIMLDLTTDPMNPVELGVFDDYYVHDGVTRGDTLWAGAINNGFISVIDVTDKANPAVIATFNTSGNFSHNCWISDDNKYLFTTDEISSGNIDSYDVTDLGNVTRLDKFQSNPGSGVIPHNTHFINNFVVTSYYADGVVITDVNRPNNMVEVASYDTDPGFSGAGFDGCWGVYPWLPSGNIIASDVQQGLFVLGPTYVQACYLEGNVTDSICGDALNNVTITIVSTSYFDSTDVSGDYAFGTPTPGTYDIQFSKPGYNTRTVSNVSLVSGQLTTIDIKLYSSTTVQVTGTVTDTNTTALQNVNVLIENSNDIYSFTTDASGGFGKCNVVSGTYDITIGKWGFVTECLTNQLIDSSNSNLVFDLQEGIYDDYSFDYGWTVTGDASAGLWARGEPRGTTYNLTQANPDFDVTGDCSDKAFVTGNNGGSAGSDDVDDGFTILISPVFDLNSYGEPYLSYYSWFFNDGGFTTPNDYMLVKLTNGTDTVLLETVDTNMTTSSWLFKNFKVNDYIARSATMQLIFEAGDVPFGHLVEAGVDMFQVVDSAPVGINEQVFDAYLSAYPNPSSGSLTIAYSSDRAPADEGLITIYDVLGNLVLKQPVKRGSGRINITAGFPTGVYLIRLQEGEQVSGTVKWVKL